MYLVLGNYLLIKVVYSVFIISILSQKTEAFVRQKIMKNKLAIFLGGVSLLTAPFAVMAQDALRGPRVSCDSVPTGTIQDIICRVANIIDTVIPILMLFAVLMFVWGVIQYVVMDEEEAKVKGRDRIIYGVVGFAAIMALWGLVAIVRRTFGLNYDTQLEEQQLPRIPF